MYIVDPGFENVFPNVLIYECTCINKDETNLNIPYNQLLNTAALDLYII